MKQVQTALRFLRSLLVQGSMPRKTEVSWSDSPMKDVSSSTMKLSVLCLGAKGCMITSKKRSSKLVGFGFRELLSTESRPISANEATKEPHGMQATLAGWISGLALNEICQLSNMDL